MKFREIFEEDEEPQRRSKAYRFTHHVGDPDTEEQLNQLRANIKMHNAQTPEKTDQFRLFTKPRIGRNNPDKAYYSGGKINPETNRREGHGLGYWGSKAGNYEPRHATRFDVYVRPKTEWDK